MLGKDALADNLAGGIQDADVMRPVTEIKAEGEPAENNGAGVRGGNDGRSWLFVFIGRLYHRRFIAPGCLPSHLILVAARCRHRTTPDAPSAGTVLPAHDN